MSVSTIRERIAEPVFFAVIASALGWSVLVWWSLDENAHHGVTRWGALVHWVAMIAAMMLPLVIRHVRLVAQRSLWRRRRRASLIFLAAYFSLWAIAGIAMIELVGRAPGYHTAAVCLVLAAVWQMSTWKQRALAACHRTTRLCRRWLGRGSRLPSIRLENWMELPQELPMLACVALPSSLLLMMGLFVFAVRERTASRPRHEQFAAVLALSAAGVAISGMR